MAVSPATRQLCDTTLPDSDAASALALLDLYAGAECERVHQAAVRLSGGRLGRLRMWLDETKRNPETILWFGESPSARRAHERVTVGAWKEPRCDIERSSRT
jgi:hypothetical protein